MEALGGHARVWACRQCNSRIGHEVEGPLLKPGSFLNLVAQTRGGGRPVPGTTDDGAPITFDFTTREIRWRKPVTVTVDAAARTKTYQYKGSPREVLKRLLRQGIERERAERMVAEAERLEMAGARFNTMLTVDLNLSQRLAAKMALGAAELALGDGFGQTPLAAALRDVLWGRISTEMSVRHGVLAAYDEILAGTVGAGRIPSIAPESSESQVAFLPHGGGTIVLAHLHGDPVGMSGLVIEAAFPATERFPIVIKDQVGQPLVRHLVDEFLNSISEPEPDD